MGESPPPPKKKKKKKLAECAACGDIPGDSPWVIPARVCLTYKNAAPPEHAN